MLQAIKTALRIKTDAFDSELTDLKDAAIADLKMVGISNRSETDPLIKRAVIVYCKMNFGKYDKTYQPVYDELKASLKISGDYI